MTSNIKIAPAFLSVKEAATRLRVHPNTLRNALNRDEIPHIRIGRTIRIAAVIIDQIEKNGTLPVTQNEGND